MKNDDLNGMFEWIKKVNFVNDRINQITKPYQKLAQIADPFYGKEHLLGLPQKIKEMNTLSNAFQNPFDSILKRNDDLYRMNSVAQQLLDNQQELRFSQSINLQLNDKIASLAGINGIVNEKINLYNHQLKLSEQIAKSLSDVMKIKSGTWDTFNSSNFTNSNGLNLFDLYSGSVFVNALSNFNDKEETFEDAYIEAEKLIEENNELKQEIVKLQTTIIALRNKSEFIVTEENWYKIYGVETMLEWFLNKILIRKLKLKVGVSYAIIYSTVALIFLLDNVRDVIIEAKGVDIYNFFSGDDKKALEKTEVIKYIALPKEINDFTIKQTSIYIRSSVKTKYLGFFPINTSVLIIKIEKDWCLVEGIAHVMKQGTVKNKKKHKINSDPIEVEKSIRGWVKKENLDMFQ